MASPSPSRVASLRVRRRSRSRAPPSGAQADGTIHLDERQYGASDHHPCAQGRSRLLWAQLLMSAAGSTPPKSRPRRTGPHAANHAAEPPRPGPGFPRDYLNSTQKCFPRFVSLRIAAHAVTHTCKGGQGGGKGPGEVGGGVWIGLVVARGGDEAENLREVALSPESVNTTIYIRVCPWGRALDIQVPSKGSSVGWRSTQVPRPAREPAHK